MARDHAGRRAHAHRQRYRARPGRCGAGTRGQAVRPCAQAAPEGYGAEVSERGDYGRGNPFCCLLGAGSGPDGRGNHLRGRDGQRGRAGRAEGPSRHHGADSGLGPAGPGGCLCVRYGHPERDSGAGGGAGAGAGGGSRSLTAR